MAVSSLAFEPSSAPRFPATAEIKPDLLFWLSPNDLLPYSKFLRRQPRGEFWMLALKERLQSPDPNQFLANPSKETLGPKPFRFESLGEVIYYLRSQRLNPKKFKFFYAGDIELGASPSPGFEGDSSLF